MKQHKFHVISCAQGCVLADYPEDTNLEGLDLIEILKIKNTTPEESVMQLYEKSEWSFILHSMEEEDVNEIAKYKYMCKSFGRKFVKS